MLIIIEGIDRTGKSTLADAIAEKVGGEVIHSSKPTRHPLREYETRLKDYVPGTGQHLILDRWHVGELVWPEIFGRKSEYDFAMFAHTEMFLRSRGALLVYATRDDHEQHARELIEFGEPIDWDQAARALDLFDRALVSRYWNESEYNFNNVKLANEVNHIVNRAKAFENRAHSIMNVTTEYVGTEDPRVLLVGERQNDKPGRIMDAPSVPFAPYRNTSGHFLLEELTRDGDAHWRGVGICNAFKDDGSPENLHDLWHVLGRPSVIALGNKAHRQSWEELGEFLDPRMVPHPQYVRRFKRSEGPGYYLGLLKEALV